MNILILVDNRGPFKRNNHLVLTNALVQKGHAVRIGQINTLSLDHGVVMVEATRLDRQLDVGDRLTLTGETESAEDADLVWVLNQPHPSIEKDVYQILWLLSRKVRFVNSLDAIMFMNNKNGIQAIVPKENMIPGLASNQFDEVWRKFNRSDDERWVVKPTNDGCGADVFILRNGDSNSRAILQSMTGNAAMRHEMHNPESYGFARRYCLLQRYIPHTVGSEKRILFAAGEVMGAYVKRFAEGEHRPNLVHGGSCELCDLTRDEFALARLIADRMLSHGINFAAIDLAFPYVFEFNLVNPGGVQTLTQLTNEDHAAKFVEKILKSTSSR